MVTRLATFRIDSQAWDEFQALARKHGQSASALLVGFVESTLAGLSIEDKNTDNLDNLDKLDKRIDNLDARIDEYINNLDNCIDARIDEYIDNLDKRVTHLDKRIDYIDSRIDESINNLDKRIDNLGKPGKHGKSSNKPPGKKQQQNIDNLYDIDVSSCLKEIEATMKVVNPTPHINDIATLTRRANRKGSKMTRKIAIELLKRFENREQAWAEFLSWW